MTHGLQKIYNLLPRLTAEERRCVVQWFGHGADNQQAVVPLSSRPLLIHFIPRSKDREPHPNFLLSNKE
jgi:hypothetical protein